MTHIKATASAEAGSSTAAVTKKVTNPWHTTCPKCHAVVHIRRKVCECGQALIEDSN